MRTRKYPLPFYLFPNKYRYVIIALVGDYCIYV
jgi:hypothetical protein